MAKKEEPKNEPVVSNLPMPISENPLVIDLPDGQKLVVGKMEPGSVIEVATWRGTGRPDSRTNRLMLGVSTSQSQSGNGSNPNSNDVSASESGAAKQAEPNRIRISIPRLGVVSFNKPKLKIPSVKSLNLKGLGSSLSKTKEKLVAKTKDLTPVESVAELDIDQWLSNIKKDAEAKVARNRSKLESKGSNQASKKKAATKKGSNKAKKSRR